MRTEQWNLLQGIANRADEHEWLFRHWCDEQRGNCSDDPSKEAAYDFTRDNLHNLIAEVQNAPDTAAAIAELQSPDAVVRELANATPANGSLLARCRLTDEMKAMLAWAREQVDEISEEELAAEILEMREKGGLELGELLAELEELAGKP